MSSAEAVRPAANLAHENLAAVHETLAAQVGERECIVFRDRRLTYGDVTRRSRRLAHVLGERGVGPRLPTRAGLGGRKSHLDHVAIYAYNGNEYLEAMLGAFKARAAPVNVNYRYVAEELQYLLSDSGATAVVYHAALAPTLAPVLPQLPDIRVLLQGRRRLGERSAARCRVVRGRARLGAGHAASTSRRLVAR